MRKILTKKFFERPTLIVAQELLGKFLCINLPCPLLGKEGIKGRCYMIIETEAYDGFKDKASHAHRGKTARNAPMFGEAGRWYVYFTYGMHWMLNIVTGPKNYPAAVLIRGLLSDEKAKNLFAGLASTPPRGQRSSREESKKAAWLSLDGPAKITKFLKINKRFNNKPATRLAGLWIESASRRSGIKIPTSHIRRVPRVGVGYAGDWAKKKYRFIIKDNEKRNFSDRTHKMDARK